MLATIRAAAPRSTSAGSRAAACFAGCFSSSFWSVALSFGLVTAAAVACLIVATAVSAPTAGRNDEERAARVETLIGGLVAAGADEEAVRALVREAVRLGKEGHRAEIPQISAPNAD